MQRWTKMLTAAGVAVLVGSQAVPALAQPPGGQGRGNRGGFGGGGMFGGGGGQTNAFTALRSEEVQKELAITEDQKTKAQKLGEEVQAAIREVPRPEFGRPGEGGPSEETMKAFAEYRTKTAKVVDDKKTALGAILSADQMKRLDEIVLQVNGADALMTPDVQAKLMLTDEQKAKLGSVSREVSEKQREEMRAAFQGDRDAAREKMAKLQKDRATALEAVLTPAQGEQWEMMKGKELANLDAVRDSVRRAGFGGRGGPGGPGGPGGGRGGDRPQRPATDN